MDKDILKKARQKIDNEKKEEEYLVVCRKAGICPKCGNKAKEIDRETVKIGFLNYKHYWGQRCTSCKWERMREYGGGGYC